MRCWWGDIGKAEIDLLLTLPNSPCILVSCKRSAEAQSMAAFIPHINAIAVSLSAQPALGSPGRRAHYLGTPHSCIA